MIHKRLLHLNWLLVLCVLTPLAFYTLITNRYANLTIFEIFVALTIIYVGSALMHHHYHKDLNLEITLEYVLTGALAIIILQSLLF